MSDVPGQEPLFDAPLPKPSGITPPASKVHQRAERSATARNAAALRRTRQRPKEKITVVCKCPKCGHDFMQDVKQ